MIAQSVGSLGVNHLDDVVVIQCGLNAFRMRQGQPALAVDGLVGPQTTGAIAAFQRSQALPADGRIDPAGATLPRLVTLIGGEQAVFGPTIAQLLPLIDALQRLGGTAPPGARAQIARMALPLVALNQFRDLTAGLPRPPDAGGNAIAFGLAGGPRVFGLTGVDDAVAAAALAAMALLMTIFLVALLQSPAFRREVQVRAKELDRIMKGLQINSSTGLKEALDLVVAVANGTIDEKNRCQQSPTFLASAECTAATLEFEAVVGRLRGLVARLIKLLAQLTTQRRSDRNPRGLRLQFNALIAEAQAEAFNLQLALAGMREACKCPDL